jgi:repressor LexA
MSILSERQRRILQFIIEFFGKNEFPPTIREIGVEVGITSTSVVNYNLAKLEELSLITRRKEVSRGLSINWDEVEKLNVASPSSYGSALPLPAAKPSNGTPTPEWTPLMRIPVLGAIAAGEPIMVEPSTQENTEDWVELPDGMLKGRGPLFALRVKGDSMVDASVLHGDIVIIRHQETANDGEMVAAWIEGDDETTLKFLYREGRNVRLQPANPAYAPIMRPADKVQIKGRVVSVIRNLDN